MSAFCSDCPDHEACSTGWPCWMVKECHDYLDEREQVENPPAAKEECEHYWSWVSPAGTRHAARLCMFCHQPDANWLNSIVEKGISMDMQLYARSLVAEYFNSNVEKTDGISITVDDVYVVWFSKTLQNWKAMVSTTISDGMYYEVTHNGDLNETYLDAYKKFNNIAIPD